MPETKQSRRVTGGCLCGAVRYEVSGDLRDVVACHCRQCLRSHGHFAAYSRAKISGFRFIEDRGLKWFQSSDKARRGFCQDCGSSLFWDLVGDGNISFTAGSIDPPSGLKLVRHIFLADKGDYYDITDDLETLPAGHGSAWPDQGARGGPV